MAADKFLEKFGSADFKSLLETAEPSAAASPPWRAPPPNPMEPEEELLRDREDQQTLQRMRDEEEDTEASEEVIEVEMEEKEGAGAKEAEENKAKQRALELYRLAEASISSAASGSSAQQATYNAAERQLAHEFGASWQARGPRGPEAPAVWRGQQWRSGSGRYGNRGGNPERQKHFADQAKKKREKERLQQTKGKGKGKAAEQGQAAGQQGKGNGKGKGYHIERANEPARILIFTNALS